MDPLSDPLNDRQVHSVEPPPHQPLSHNLLFPVENKPNWRLLKDHLIKEGRVSKADLMHMIELAVSTFRRERNLLELKDPVTVVGDIHGQFYDFIKMLDIGGNPENTKYLFLGDFVDRGNFSIEVVLLLYAIKLNYPDTIYMIRGNHECRQMTSFFNFRGECLSKYDEEVYEAFMESFDTLPLSTLINGKFLAVHGGISPELTTLASLNQINRFQEPPRQGIYCDILWSDPVDTKNGKSREKYKANETRGCAFFFNVEAANTFLKRNKLLSIVRAHEAQLDGYKLYKWNGESEFPTVITVFSAPNYCDVYNNKGAIIKFENNTLNIQQYNYTSHPYVLPDFMDIFSWSVPFVVEKALDIILNMVKKREPEGQSPVIEETKGPADIVDPALAAKAKRYELMRKKVKSVGKMALMFKNLRENHEKVVQLKGLAPDNKIPIGLLMSGAEEMDSAIDRFSNARNADSINEKRPT